MATTLTFYGGIGEVGGPMTLLESHGSRVWVEAGKSFNQYRKWYGGWDRPTSFEEWWETGLIPRLKQDGVYRNDLIESLGRKPIDEPYVQAVVNSHSHLDHSAYDSLLHEDTTIHGGRDLWGMMRGYEDLAVKSLDTQMTSWTDTKDPFPDLPDSHFQALGNFQIYWGQKKDRRTKQLKWGWIVKGANNDQLVKYPDRIPTHQGQMIYNKIKPQHERKFNLSTSFKIDDIEFDLYPVDHSAYDAHGMIINTPDARIVYTGDLRGPHGPNGHKTRRFIEKAAKDPVDLLWMDCTRVNEERMVDGKPYTEKQVQSDMTTEMITSDDLIMTMFNERDLNRYNSVFRACEDSGRTLVTFPKALMYWMSPTPTRKTREEKLNVKGERPRGVRNMLQQDFKIKYDRNNPIHYYDKGTRVSSRYNRSIKSITFKEELSIDDLVRKPDDYVLHLRQTDKSTLMKVGRRMKAKLLVSMSEPHDEEGEISEDRLIWWCSRYDIPHRYIHTSGHMQGHDAKEMIEQIDPRIIIPAHCGPENIELMKLKYPSRVKVPELYKPFKLRTSTTMSTFF